MKRDTSDLKEIRSPSGLDLNPDPPSPMRLSKRAGIAVFVLVFVVVALIGYGIVTRRSRSLEIGFQKDDPRSLTAATDTGAAIAAQVPDRFRSIGDAQPESAEALHAPGPGADAPRIRSAHPPPPTPPQYREPSPVEQLLARAYERELQARDAPMTTGSGGPEAAPSTDASQLTNLLNRARPQERNGAAANSDDEYDKQNLQAHKIDFVNKARTAANRDYLDSTRTKPAGRYEIKAGWDIPAVLEQGLNSDLPGEIKALVREDIYDTATGRFLLIPKGARLVGAYDSRVGYGQSAIQVVWNRIIFPDASSIDLEGMIGQDAQGLSGLRHSVDNHYRRLLGFGLLTSAFSASFQLSQSRRGSVLGYPSPGEIAGSSIGGEISQLGADVTRRNLNIQPTIKVPVGYRFNVRVNRDIVFEAPY